MRDTPGTLPPAEPRIEPDVSPRDRARAPRLSTVAPPKRKTGGGRTTPKGTRPGEQRIANPTENERGVHASTRYTPPVTSEMRMPKPWIPYLMIGLFVLGMVVIIVKNLGLVDSNWLTLVGLACILGGLYTATKWR
jgi:hypothetical protein